LQPGAEHGLNILVETVSTERPPTIDPVAAARWQRTAPPVAPWLHEEVGRRMEDRLQWIKRDPAAWAHWDALRGGLGAHAAIARRYPRAACYLVDSSPERTRAAMQALAKPWWRRLAGTALHQGPVPPAGVQMVWANMLLHMAADPQALISQWQQALAVDGFLMFSCLGPDTLAELRRLYAALGWPAAGHQFTDMHDWGDMLVASGMAEPVMDMERITLTFETPQRLLLELRELGVNLHPARFPALRGRRWREQLERELAHALRGPDGRLALTFEIIYGHAFKPPPKVRVSAESAFSVGDLRGMLQAQPRERR
jgi:malonyl-CoA O-methyltransferase